MYTHRYTYADLHKDVWDTHTHMHMTAMDSIM